MAKDLSRINTVAIIMMSGRSFDHILGYMGLPDSGHPQAGQIEGIQHAQAYYSHDTYQPGPITSPSLTPDPPHERENIDTQIKSVLGPMRGFAQSYQNAFPSADGARVMEYCTNGYLPSTDLLARDFAICDRWFACLPAGTLPNRLMAMSGYALVDHTPRGYFQIAQDLFHNDPDDLVYDWLTARGVSWRVYLGGYSFFFMQMPRILKLYEGDVQLQNLFRPIDRLMDDFRNGDVPQVVFIEPMHEDDYRRGSAAATDDQSPASLHGGQRLLKIVYDALTASPTWNNSVAFITYDQHGGFFDHVVPPRIQTSPLPGAQYTQGFDTLGVRVPGIVVSPFVRPGQVYHGVLDHTSILKFLGDKFGNGSYSSIVDSRQVGSLAEVLDEDLLASPAPTADQRRYTAPAILTNVIAGYTSDAADGERDLLGIDREVNAFCLLAAAKDVKPPISIGLFGNWGAGKTVFMKRMERRIRVLSPPVDPAKQTVTDGPYCNNIVQLWFNAWHYIDTDLWATLASQIFEGLANTLATNKREDVESMRARLLQAAAGSRGELEDAKNKKDDAEKKLKLSEQHLEEIKKWEPTIAASLSALVVLDQARKIAVETPEIRAQLEQAAKTLGLTEIERSGEDIKRQLDELEGLVGHARALWLWFLNGNYGVRLNFLALMVISVVALWWLPRYASCWLTWLGPVATLVIQILGSASALLVAGKPMITAARKALAVVDRARSSTEELIRREREKKEQVLLLQQDRMKSEREAAEQRVLELTKAIESLGRQIEELRVARQMSNFILERYKSSDYTSHLGIISTAHHDFERLSKFIENRADSTDSESKPLPVDRIVLYIDDLDRCPEDKVVKVLEAVHMLLAFPLFVVVVGVDSRWLLHSLKQKSEAFHAGSLDDVDRHWQSTPLDYLEKIFQIPFALRPMDEIGFAKIVQELTKSPEKRRNGNTESRPGTATKPNDAGDSTRGSPAAPTSTSGDAANSASAPGAFDSVRRQSTEEQGNLSAETLRLEDRERQFMERLSCLIRTPRGAKRFINTYRLLRASIDEEERLVLTGRESLDDGLFRSVLLLLAILIGYPNQATDILASIVDRGDQTKLWTLIDELVKARSKPEPRSATPLGLVDAQWVELNKSLPTLRSLFPNGGDDCRSLSIWARKVARYSFESGQVIS
jgi:phospholipase C